MNLSERIEAFSRLGETLSSLSIAEKKELAHLAHIQNPWFTDESVLMAFTGIDTILKRDELSAWANSYSLEPTNSKVVGVAMAGNIPMVGFHDFMCVLISGHKLKAKLSSQDSVLMKFVLKKLVEIEPRFAERVEFAEMLKDVDAMIATGSDNTARYFEYYFRNVPHIIRKNRGSCGVILGEEPAEELKLLGKDVFSYFGLGCRNVSKIYIPEDYSCATILDQWEEFQPIIYHNNYANNYTYQRSLYLMNSDPFLDNGFLLLRESTALVSPMAVLYYERYKSQDELKKKIAAHKEKLQVIVSASGWFSGSIAFGTAQFPAVDEYADNVDTMVFLGKI